MIKTLIRILQNKHDAFIGNQNDEITSAEARGFKQGLKWAIDTAETMIINAKLEQEYDLEQAENEIFKDAYRDNEY